MQGNVRRIHIVGAAGNGKTSLAKQLAARLSAPCYELDLVMYEGGSGRKRDLETRLADLRAIIAQPAWITEGSYLWWASDLFRAADLIIWLDLPWYRAIYRLIIRHFKASLAGTNRHPGMMKLLRFVWQYRGFYLSKVPDTPTGLDDDRAGNRAAMRRFLSAFSDKLIHYRKPVDVETILSQLRTEPAQQA